MKSFAGILLFDFSEPPPFDFDYGGGMQIKIISVRTVRLLLLVGEGLLVSSVCSVRLLCKC